MQDPIGSDQIARLEACVASDPGAMEFVALTEALRRAGRLQDAEHIARCGLEYKPGSMEGSLALALVLLDQGRVDEARESLTVRAAECLEIAGIPSPDGVERAAGEDAAFTADVTDNELEQAFAVAEPDRDQIIDADRLAQEAMRGASLDHPEIEDVAAASVESDPIFATRTMATLLENQGDSAGAARIRVSLAETEVPEAVIPVHAAGREQIIATLETWLTNLRRDPT